MAERQHLTRMRVADMATALAQPEGSRRLRMRDIFIRTSASSAPA